MATTPDSSAEPTMKASVRVEGLCHWFGEGEARKQVLYDIGLTLAAGQLTILSGASGSGKTTLLTLIGSLRRLQKGSVRMLGTELFQADEATLIQCRRRAGFIFQSHNLHASLTAAQNVRLGLDVHEQGQLRHPDEAIGHLLGLLGLADRQHYLPDQLSGGQKQRVAVARALIANPEIVFADEPTAALDRDSALNVVHMLKRLGQHRGTTTLMVTHDVKIIDLADRVIRLEEGRIVSDTMPPPTQPASPM